MNMWCIPFHLFNHFICFNTFMCFTFNFPFTAYFTYACRLYQNEERTKWNIKRKTKNFGKKTWRHWRKYYQYTSRYMKFGYGKWMVPSFFCRLVCLYTYSHVLHKRCMGLPITPKYTRFFYHLYFSYPWCSFEYIMSHFKLLHLTNIPHKRITLSLLPTNDEEKKR